MFAFRLFTFVVSLLLPLTLSYGQKDHRFTLFTLCRNSDLNEMAETILNYNLRVENISNYDWVFLNDQPFSPEFEKLISSIVQGRARFGIVDPEIWNIPSHIDQDQMKFNIEQALNDEDGPYPYADSITYRNMCRFMSGGFQWHPLMLEYTHFWRVEPGVKLYCDTEIVIEDYAFTISMIEYPKTVTTLMDSVIEGLESLGLQHLLSPDSDNLSEFVFDPSRGYTLCHFWTNFEIGSLDLLRSDTYKALFDFLDRKGGFYYERWGDAPVRTILLSLLLKKGEIKRLKDWAYFHPPYTQCPQQESLDLVCGKRCTCDPQQDFTNVWFSCASWFDACNAH